MLSCTIDFICIVCVLKKKKYVKAYVCLHITSFTDWGGVGWQVHSMVELR
jgi:hypothetical protein